jgi:hypothetical protein
MKANDLRTAIATVLADYRAFYGDNTGSFDESIYKINYQISSAILNEYQRTYMVDFDIWCTDTVEVETIADELETLFNYRTYESATFYLENRYHADEKELYRRTLVYEVRTFNEH